MLFTLSGCKKEADPTPLETIAGEYNLTATVIATVDGKTTVQTGTGTLSVFKGNTPGTYYFLEKYPSYQISYMTNHDGKAFKMEQTVDMVRYGNIEYYGYQNGTGNTDINKITINKVTNAGTGVIRNQQGLEEYVTKAITRSVSIVATK
jgi:hypothetical protein